ncbi:c-type cytochrome [Inmirania thermothiophila]|uniref:Sulfide dehydrogenase (Flavocytochrome c) cytochrome c subunit n=1 Tax=Inmirania thermothiophila TaxID=1750597 RepID=A0A3N1Y1H4_9GAMM|nr:c-type cytochrome [Inmirania thermothiophila]ROR32665.1 sulfide dehydrogenase (flavocytochrome c) cytochrome c subunit [Inmirania thermothiophila]
MKTVDRKKLLALAGGVLLASGAFAAPSGRMLADTCAGCHGTDGVSNGPATPTIAGISKTYFLSAMLAYKYGGDEEKIEQAAKALGVDPGDIETLPRTSTVMARIARGYSDQEILAMADHFASKKFVGHRQKVDGELARKGERLHKDNCEKCHEEGGRVGDGAGILAGQWKTYLEFAIADFRSGDRAMPKKMRAKMKDLSDEDLEALIHYYAGQK